MLNGVSGMIGETAVVRKAVSDSHQPGSVFSRVLNQRRNALISERSRDAAGAS